MKITKLLLLPLAIISLVSCDNQQPTTSLSSSSSSNQDFNQNINLTIEQIDESLKIDISLTGTINLSNTKYEIYNSNNELISNVDNVLEDMEIELPRHGKFTLVVKNKTDNTTYLKSNFTLDVAEINIGYLRATAPVSIFSYLALQKDIPSYIVLDRGSTYKWDYLPSNWHLVPGIRENYQSNDFDSFHNNDLPATRMFIRDLVTDLPDVKVNLYTCDADETDMVVDMFKYFSEDNFTVNFLTDGTWTNSAFSENLKTYDQYLTYKNNVEDVLKNINSRPNYNTINNIEGNFALASIKDNVNYYVYDKAALINNTQDEQLKELIDKTLTKLSYQEMYETFNKDANLKSKFEYLFGTRWSNNGQEESVAELFGESSKPNLVILGTSPSDEDSYKYNFEQTMNFIIENYSDTYDIFYKGHPAYPSNDERVDYFNKNNIVELPGSTPAEILLTFYPDVYTGGYLTTTFLSAKENQIICIFSTEEELNNNSTYSGVLNLFENTTFVFDELAKN